MLRQVPSGRIAYGDALTFHLPRPSPDTFANDDSAGLNGKLRDGPQRLDLFGRRTTSIRAFRHCATVVYSPAGNVLDTQQHADAGSTDAFVAHHSDHHVEMVRLRQAEDALLAG